jgi:hypothetical protein
VSPFKPSQQLVSSSPTQPPFELPAGTPREELDQLQDVIGRVCQFHVADSKPVQVPGPEQVSTPGLIPVNEVL